MTEQHGDAQGCTQIFPIPNLKETYREAKNSDIFHTLARICFRIFEA